ncbi:protein artichoke [Stomoxys calcitrans]|uniref:protein artichoke n=1 Tax=Stomoxys calcitrans TaxID=35570 RepID=UPI0027E35FC4|nr:protein artichoke [Stomoxys calcitrans]XP_013108531.2 protein artichoke [Stomoxys calcitrans]XP_013108533.2 protein artichoke [Stomoxys calcitrans]XP_013108534.2 protein artichoke [Stomoxys calcitrans]
MKKKRGSRLLRINGPWRDWSSWLFYCWLLCYLIASVRAEGCPPSEAILPCRCSLRGKEIQIWCSHSNLPQIIDGLKAVERNVKGPIDELVLENNQLPALPGRFFGSLQIVRLMLRYNIIERVSNGWLNELENSLVEIYIVEPQLRSIPVESLNGMINMVAITIQSDELKHLPDFSGLLSLTYLSVQSRSLTELQPQWFRHLPKLQNIHITGGENLNRLESGLFDGMISLKNIDLSRNGINWIHLRALARLPNLVSLKLSYNQISDVGMVGRVVKDLENLKKLRLDHNIINIIEDGSFVDLPHLSELHLNDNRITEIEYGAFLRTPMLKTIYLHNNHIKRIHPESFMQASGSGVETMYIYNNEIDDTSELRSLLEALPALKFLDISNNFLRDIHYGALRGHGTLEQLHINNNQLRNIERDALMAMPALRELRMRNNSLSHDLPMPFWNLPGLKGLDLSLNNFRWVDSFLLAGLPSLRRLDLSENDLSKLDPTTYIHNPMLETLNISLNELEVVHPATFRNLDRLFEVDASFNQMLEMIPGLPKIVERISVRGNLIAHLPASKSLNLPNLRMLDISLNRLEHLPKYAFQGLPQLRVLSLANNRLRSLDDTVFIGSNRLELLHLQENHLMIIDERALLPLSELRNLNMNANKLSSITDNLFSNNSKLEQLDLSRNSIRTISPLAFESQKSLEYLDLSANALSDMSISLANLMSLKDIDLSYNQITHIHSEVVAAWRQVVEIRLSNNLITELNRGTFRNLIKLQYLDLSSNEIQHVEQGALKNLPELQEFVLADNKLSELKEHAFEDLPNLLASHFQYNNLRFISSESFFNSPSMVFLNLSNNHFRNMENIGLRSMRNLEVLDLSTNAVRTVHTMPLKLLNWLVELKMDNNEICRIQGSPFETMPRLRVLSMRNNRLRSVKERTFRNLRGNIAIIDMDGNPIDCSCEMQWLSVWLQETNFPYPGPKCQDGRLLRSSRIDKNLCNNLADNQQRNGAVAYGESDGSVGLNNLPLLNEHGDIFQRELQNYNDECEAYELPPAERPLAGESEYFYDQYVDYPPGANETFSPQSHHSNAHDNPALSSHISTSNTVLHAHKKPSIPNSTSVSPNVDLNNTILNTNHFKKKPGLQNSPYASSPFTFFGYPIPSLSLGRFFGANERGRKDRGEHGGLGVADRNPSTTTTEMPATHRMFTGSHGKVRMYQPNSAEFEKYLKNKDDLEDEKHQQYFDINGRKRLTDISSDETSSSSENPSSVFKTGFRVPSSVERGGFKPIVPEHTVGGFIPVHDPSRRRGTVEVLASSSSKIDKTKRLNQITANESELKNRMPIVTTTTISSITQSSMSEEMESQTYYVTENDMEETTTFRPLSTLRKYQPSITTTSSTTTTTTVAPSTTTTNQPTASDSFDSELYDDLEAQSVTMMKPPPLVQTTTSETILLIPPPEELVEQIKRQSWKHTTPNPPESQETHDFVTTITTSTTTTSTTSVQHSTTSPPLPYLPRPGGAARSTVTKVHHHHNLPTAEEYQRTTPSLTNKSLQQQQRRTTEEPQLTANAQKRDEPSSIDRMDRKDGMDWYYESFKKSRAFGSTKPAFTGSSSLKSSAAENRYVQTFSTVLSLIALIIHKCFIHTIAM